MKKILFILMVVISTNSSFAQTAIQWEYFFDVDSGFGSNTVLPIVPPDTNILVLDTLQIPVNIAPGYHKFYSRVQDSFGNWSLTTRRNVEVIESDDSLYVVEVEYFFVDSLDLDFGGCHDYHITVPFTDDVDTFYIPNSQIPFGKNNDTLFMRVRDSADARWSLTTYIDSLNYGTVGIEEKEKYLLKVSPNPATRIITVEFSEMPTEPVQLTLSNVFGEQLARQDLTSQKTTILLNYPDGMYLLIIRNSKKTIVQKFIIQKL